jgi:hypothetical protein
MADYNPAVSLGINPPDPQGGLNTLSNIMKLGQQGLAIRGAQSENITKASQATIAQQTAKENQNLAGLMSDPIKNGIVDQDGNPTPDAQKIVMQAAPTTGSEHYENIVKAATTKVNYNSAINNLRTSDRAELAQAAGGVAARAQSPDEINDALDQVVASKAGTPEEGNYKTIASTMKQAINHLAKKTSGNNPPPAGQEPWRVGAANMAASILPASASAGPSGLTTPTAGVQNLGGTNQPIVQAPALAGGAVTQVPGATTNTTPPAIMTGPNQQILRVPGAGPASPVDVKAPPQSPAPPGKLQTLQRPGPNAPAADQANYNARIKQAGDEQQAVSNAANDPQNGVQVSRYRNGQILDLTRVAPTGPGKEIWNHIASQFPGQGADAFQKIGHYLAQNSAAMAGKMGVPNTNMGQETAAAAAGNVSQNPEAIKEITKVNDALNTGFDLYNRGLGKVTDNGSDLSKVPAYKQAFGSNLDVNALRWADANRRNDREEIASLSKQGPKAIASWQQKLSTLKSLATTGDLP